MTPKLLVMDFPVRPSAGRDSANRRGAAELLVLAIQRFRYPVGIDQQALFGDSGRAPSIVPFRLDPQLQNPLL